MPTGYTAEITSNPDFTVRQFIINCARAFGACMHQRDEASTSPPRHREMGTFEAERVKKTEAALAESASTTLEQAAALAKADFEAKLKHWRESYERRGRDRCAYLEMRQKIEAWTPPTEEHVDLRKFMLSQIDDSIRFDCDYDWPAPLPEAPAVWLAAHRERDERALASAKKGLADETERVRKANAWIDALYASLPEADERR